MAETPRVLLAIRARLVSDGIAASLARDDLEVVGMATDARDAIGLVPVTAPHVVVLDASLAPLTTVDMVQEFANGQARVVLLSSGWGAIRELEQAREHIHGFVPLTEPARVLADTIRRVARGERVVPEGRPAAATIHGPSGDVVRIGGKQLQVLELVAHGLTNAEVAASLGISARTADNHRTALMRKLEVRRVVQLVRLAIRAGLVNP